MQKTKSWEIITQKGKDIQQKWLELASSNNLQINISGIPALSEFNFNSKSNLKYKTLISQEMLKDGILASNKIYVCTEHKDKILNLYYDKLNNIFNKISHCESGRLNIDELLLGETCHSGFRRLI